MENFSQVESNILNKIKKVSDRNSLDLIKTEIFGKKGIITELFKKIGNLDQSQKKEYALKLNDLKTKIIKIFEKKLIDFDQSEINKKLKNEKIDITLIIVSFYQLTYYLIINLNQNNKNEQISKFRYDTMIVKHIIFFI